MADLMVYLSAEEKAWVKRHRPGDLRKMVQALMAEYPDGVPEEELDEDHEEEG